MKRKFLFLGVDILAAALILLAVWVINYKIPQKGTQAIPLQQITEVQKNVNMGNNTAGSSLQKTDVPCVSPTISVRANTAELHFPKVKPTERSRSLSS